MGRLAADGLARELGTCLVGTERLDHLSHLRLDIVESHELVEFCQSLVGREHLALLEGDVLGLDGLIDIGGTRLLGEFADAE